jgi:nucleoid-associated protein YgaU
MSTGRLIATAGLMAAMCVVLADLTPAFPAMTDALISAQGTVDTRGVDALITSAAGLLAWVVWAWGAVGLALTAGAALPGIAGEAARLAVQVVLPAGARRSAALLLGVGLGIAVPVAGGALPVLASAASAAAPPVGDVPDWPAAVPEVAPVPDWPTGTAPPVEPPGAPAAGHRVVVHGDCLWHIAADSLLRQLGRLPGDGEVAAAVEAWWRANVDVIGPDPDRLLPGQVLRAPGPP